MKIYLLLVVSVLSACQPLSLPAEFYGPASLREVPASYYSRSLRTGGHYTPSSPVGVTPSLPSSPAKIDVSPNSVVTVVPQGTAGIVSRVDKRINEIREDIQPTSEEFPK